MKRRRKGEVTKAKERLWELCRQITKKRHGNTCYTCGRHMDGGKGQHTGHFITSSTCSTELRYDLRNLRPQCYYCNIHLSGNWVAYERHLEADFGTTYIQELKDRNEATKGRLYPLQWYLDKIREYELLL